MKIICYTLIITTGIDNFNITIIINQLRVDRVKQDIITVHFFDWHHTHTHTLY